MSDRRTPANRPRRHPPLTVRNGIVPSVKIDFALEIVLLEKNGRDETEEALTPRDFLHRYIEAAGPQRRERDPITRPQEQQPNGNEERQQEQPD